MTKCATDIFVHFITRCVTTEEGAIGFSIYERNADKNVFERGKDLKGLKYENTYMAT